MPSGVKVITIEDGYSFEDLVNSFKGHDVVINAVAHSAISEQYRFIEAAVEAGVKRFIPSEFGLDNTNPRARAISSVFDQKAKVREFLIGKEKFGLSWTVIACGVWIDWYVYDQESLIHHKSSLHVIQFSSTDRLEHYRAMKNNFLGFRILDKTMILTDNGAGKFSCTTMDNTALAVNHVLLHPSQSSNRAIYTSDFAANQEEILAAVERISGEKWIKEYINGEESVKRAAQRIANGDPFAKYDLINIAFTKGGYSGLFEGSYKVSNEEFGLPKRELQEVVRAALKQFD
jgi:hypothetical protein